MSIAAQNIATFGGNCWSSAILGFSLRCWAASLLCVDGTESGAAGLWQESDRLGLQPSAANIVHLLQKQPAVEAILPAPVGVQAAALLAKSAARHDRREEVLLVPLPNDTISEEYWLKVDDAIAEAARATPRPATLNDLPPEATKEPWRKVFEASNDAIVVDTPDSAANAFKNWELGTPMPMLNGDATIPQAPTHRSVSVVPYDMQLGARIMYGLSEKGTPAPLPTQLEVDEEFTANCPMVLMAAGLRVLAPRCGLEHGQWKDPSTDRIILRWIPNGQGGLHFAVDSLITGNGSVTFADFSEAFSIKGYFFHLKNCLRVERYLVEEAVVKVDHMAEQAYSTVYDHDLQHSKEAIFYRYTVKRPDGTPVAATALFRLGQNEVNITKFGEDAFAHKSLIATAKREGHWVRDQWRKCTGTQRGWNLEFPLSTDVETVATVQDLRIVAASIINMMAYREEEVGADGLQHSGQAAMYWKLVKIILIVFFGSVLLAAMWIVIRKRAVDKKLRRLFFRIEQVALPKRVAKVRQPVLQPTY